jgi:hypothetical protein
MAPINKDDKQDGAAGAAASPTGKPDMSPGARAARQVQLRSNCDQISSTFFARGATPEQRVQLTAKWGGHMPLLLNVLADAMDEAPEVYKALPFTSGDVRDDEAMVRETTEAKATVDALDQLFGDTVLVQRGDAYDRAMQVFALYEAVLLNPTISDAQKQSLKRVMARANAIVDSRNKAISDTKANNANLRAEGEANTNAVSSQLTQAQLLNRILLGQDPAAAAPAPAPAPAAAPAPAKKGRRTTGTAKGKKKSGKKSAGPAAVSVSQRKSTR